MTLEQFSYLATIIGTLSIPLSGLFIWLQLRQQTRLAKVANTQALVELSSPFNLQLIQDKEMARLWVLGATSYDNADEVEKYRYKSLLIWWLILHENIYYQWQNGLLDKPIYDSWRFDLQHFVLRQLDARWTELRPAFTQAFALHIDELIKSPNHALQRTGAAVTPAAPILPPSPTPPGSGRASGAGR